MDLQKYMMDIANDRVKQCQRYLKICNLLDDSGKATDFKDKRERIDKITHKLGIELGDNDFGAPSTGHCSRWITSITNGRY